MYIGLRHVRCRRVQSAEAQGTAISAKFELDDQKQLQLSVYTMKGNAFSEVVVDQKTGKIVKTEPITEGRRSRGRQGSKRSHLENEDVTASGD
jgi:hypothetical protein